METILLIMPLCYNYNEDVILSLREIGYRVVFIPDFDESIPKKIFRKYSKNAFSFVQDRYIRKKIRNIDHESIDKVLIIRGNGFPYSTVKYLKQKYSKSKFILYQWDPLSISQFDVKAVNCFDRCYSFDSSDCQKITKLEYLPLFYCDRFNYDGEGIKYDFSFIGSIHSNRFKILLDLIQQMENQGFTFFIKGYINRLKYYVGCLKNLPGYRDFPKKYITFKQVPRENTQKIFKQSRAVIDISHPLQTGLSIRVIEVLSKKRKLLTTNTSIENETFYNSNVIGIIRDNKLPSDIKSFIRKDGFIDISILEVKNWVKLLLK